MRANLTFLSGVGMGVTAMYLIDPTQGRRRRARVRDAAIHGVRKAADATGATARDLQHRAQGTAARLRQLRQQEPVADRVLVERVRARLGRYVSHPRAIDVSAIEGVVTLSGPVLAHEHSSVLSAMRSVPGVRDLVDLLEPHRDAGNIPSLQGGAAVLGEPSEIWQRQWTPALRFMAGVAGTTLAVYGAGRRDAVGLSLALFGLGLVARGTTNLETSRLTGIGAGRRAIDIQKTIDISAPVQRVFDFWRRIEDFPNVTSSVRDVRRSSDGAQSHWTVAGPAGIPVEFDAIVTDYGPHDRIGWKTVEGTGVQHAGLVRFEPIGAGTTRVHIRMSYNPPGGAIGHAAAAAVGQDLRRLLDDELVRIKTFIETGRGPHDAARRSESALL